MLGITLFGITGMASWLGFAWGGVLVTSIVVWIIGTLSGGRINPVRLTLAGVALSAVLTGITSSISLLNPQAFDQLRIWEAGTLDVRSMHNIALATPTIILGCILALMAARSLNTLSMGKISPPRWEPTSFWFAVWRCWRLCCCAAPPPRWSAPSVLSV